MTLGDWNGLGGKDTDEEGVKRWTDDSPLLFSAAWLVGKGHKGSRYNCVVWYPRWGWSNSTPTHAPGQAISYARLRQKRLEGEQIQHSSTILTS